jgi:radical SAM superfamily enzyme YgiQ (UPF0313 family)
MKKIKILLSDPRHSTVGIHSNCVPIGIGYIASYIFLEFQNNEKIKIDIQLSTDISETLDIIKNWRPDILGVSNYIWNSSASNLICEYAKEQNQNILCILGGPEFPAGTGQRLIKNTIKDATYDKCLDYLKKRPAVDFFAYVDGEVAFIEIIKKFVENNFSLKNLKYKDVPVNGFASLSVDKRILHVGKYIDRIGMKGSIKENGRDIIPSPYSTGLLDKFLDGTFLPAFETSRGCPFLCAFCDQGLDASKISAFSSERLAEELLYVAKKIANKPGATKAISIFDSNWGMYKKDVELADSIREIMDEYDWPQYIECLTPKSNRENILKINDKLKNRVALQLSMQSMNLDVLETVKRKNWTTDEYIDFINQIRKRGKASTSEMIIPLPGETIDTYFDGVKFLMDKGIQPETYTLMLLVGAEFGRDESIRKHNMKSKYRILPKQFGKYDGKTVLEIEKICIGTNNMSEEEYLKCRNFGFLNRVLSQPIFSNVYKLCKKLDISWFDVSKKFSDYIQSNQYHGQFKNIYLSFCRESKDELFNTPEEANEFYSKEENYNSLLKGEVGENLIAKYTVQSLSSYSEILNIIFKVMKKDFKENLNRVSSKLIDSAILWLNDLYIVDEILDIKTDIENEKKINLDFDFPNWIKTEETNTQQYQKSKIYKIYSDKKMIADIKKEMIINFGKDKNRAFGRYLERRGRGNINFLEKNYAEIN